MSSYYLVAIAIVLTVPVVAVSIVAGAVALVRDAFQRSRLVATAGIAATAVAVGSLFVERTCAGTSNRPVVTAIVGPDSCRAAAMAAIELVILLTVGTALAARVRLRR